MALLAKTVLFFVLSCGLWIVDGRKFNSILTVPNGGRRGEWGPIQFCPKGYAISFRTKEEEYGTAYDSTGLNAIALMCEDGTTITSTAGPDNTVLVGSGIYKGRFDRMSNRCKNGSVCGIQTRVQSPQPDSDDTAVNDVRLYCCD